MTSPAPEPVRAPVLRRAAEQLGSPAATSRQTQRRAVRSTALLLALLAVGLGLRNAAQEPAPRIPAVQAPEQDARGAPGLPGTGSSGAGP